MKILFQPIIVSIFLFTILLNAQNDTFPLENKNVLIVYGGWEGHQPEVFATKIASWLKGQKAIVTISDSTQIYLDKTVMSKVDLIIQHITHKVEN